MILEDWHYWPMEKYFAPNAAKLIRLGKVENNIITRYISPLCLPFVKFVNEFSRIDEAVIIIIANNINFRQQL